jgi:hypothetical protein
MVQIKMVEQTTERHFEKAEIHKKELNNVNCTMIEEIGDNSAISP